VTGFGLPTTSRRLSAGPTFSSLRNRNFRLYFAGQGASLCGTWMQRIAQSWLVLELTHSGTALGLATATQFVPMLALGAYGGLVADRVAKRRLLVATQAAQAALALALGILTITGAVRLWMVFALAAALGITNVFDTPGRQSFVLEMVGPRELRNAVTLNSVLVNAARAIGPAAAGVLIATAGTGVCFLVNAASFVGVIASLVAMDASRFHPAAPVARARGQVRAGLRYVARTPALRTPLLVMAAIGTLAYEFQIVLPLVARHTFHGGAGAYGAMTAAMGAGAVAGGLVVARRSEAPPTALVRSAIGFGVVILAAAAAPSMGFELAALVAVGAGSVAFLALANTTLQLASAPQMRGRVMALWAIAFMGTTPIGGPIVGWLGQHAGPRPALAIGGLTAILAGAAGAASLRRRGREAAREATERDCEAAPRRPRPRATAPAGERARVRMGSRGREPALPDS
jgi:MFS family permease